MAQVGCQPPFSRFEVKGLRLCDNWTLLKRYNEEVVRFYPDTKSNIIGSSKCLMPCSFMEYKVSNKHAASPIVFSKVDIEYSDDRNTYSSDLQQHDGNNTILHLGISSGVIRGGGSLPGLPGGRHWRRARPLRGLQLRHGLGLDRFGNTEFWTENVQMLLCR